MAKHRNCVWLTRLEFDRPYQEVRTEDTKNLRIAFFPGKKRDGISITIPRKDARLLAKRINQCLDGTLSKPRKTK